MAFSAMFTPGGQEQTDPGKDEGTTAPASGLELHREPLPVLPVHASLLRAAGYVHALPRSV
jgi:hypothetical protein